jgi:serine/threonine protein kinase
MGRGYIAPEVFTDNNYSLKADIFSFGCVLYEAITGQIAFILCIFVQHNLIPT